jgi:hypothetical protein
MPFKGSVLLFISIFFTLYSVSQTIGGVDFNDEDQLPKWVKIDSIIIKNNRITKPFVIINEFEYKVGDSIPRFDFINKTIQSRTNLVNRQLFSEINLNILIVKEGRAIVEVYVKERWNIWPAPVIQIDAPNINEFLQRKDWSRLSYGASLGWSNFFGTGHKLKLRAVFGNSNQVNVSYEIPKLAKKLYLGLTPWLEYKGLRSVNYKTSDDSQVLFQADDHSFQSLSYGVDMSFRHNFFMKHLMRVGYESTRVSDTLLSANQTYLTLDSANQIKYFSLGYDMEFDKADSKTYPLKGYFVKVGIDKKGIGIVKDAETDVFYLNAEISGYVPISKRFFWGAKARIRFMPGQLQPYVFRNGLGYDKVDYIRGYELYSIEGTNYAYFKTNFKFQALNKVWEFTTKKKKKKPKKKKKENPKSEVFKNREKKNHFPLAIYINAFGECGYVRDPYRGPDNLKANEFLLGFGGSVDIVTVYDVVLRLEYVANRDLDHGFRLGLRKAF